MIFFLFLHVFHEIVGETYVFLCVFHEFLRETHVFHFGFFQSSGGGHGPFGPRVAMTWSQVTSVLTALHTTQVAIRRDGPIPGHPHES